MVWCGVVWCGVVWCGVVWCGVVWCGVVWRCNGDGGGGGDFDAKMLAGRLNGACIMGQIVCTAFKNGTNFILQ